MKIDTYIKFTGIDKYGNIIAERKEEKAHSLVQGFIASLYNMAFNTTVANVPDTGNVNRTLSTSQFSWSNTGYGASGDNTSGIVAGTGTNAVAITNYSLQTIIPHGTGSGELEYAGEILDEGWTVSGSTSYFSRKRTLTNNSGGAITINEVGHIARIGSSGFRILTERTKPIPYEIANGTGVIITYKWQISV